MVVDIKLEAKDIIVNHPQMVPLALCEANFQAASPQWWRSDVDITAI